MTHCASTMLAFNSFCSAGNATFTTVPSINAMLEAITVAARIHGAARRVQIAVGGVARTAPSSQGNLANVVISRSYLDGLPLLRHDDLRRRAFHLGDKLVGILLDD